MRDEAWIEAGKRMILRQFYIRESMRIFLMFVMCMVVSILWAVSTGQMVVFLIAIGITVIVILRMVTIGSREFRNAFADLYPPRQEQIIMDYLQPHTIYRLFGGEVHMLSDAMVCRSGAKLLLILPEEVDVIKTMKYSGESAFVRGVWITTDTMKKYRLEFMSGQQQNIKHIVMWLKHKKPEITWQRNS
ncbi:hypothetical protein [Anaerotignum lactatifermentans]